VSGLRRIRRLQWLAAGVLAVGIGGMLLTSGAGAQVRDSSPTGNSGPSNTNSYSLSAQSNALDVLFVDPSAPLASAFALEGGPWGSSATLNSLGESMADAGAPYSPSIDSLPGTINGLGSGNFPPLPPLPGYVSAQYPGTPDNTQTQGGYQISSKASPSSAKGTVSLGVQPSGSPNPTFFASAETTANGDGSVGVSASAGMDVLDFGQLFDIGNVSSSVSLTQQANQPPKVTSQTHLGTVTLVGRATGLAPGGLSALGVGTPLDVNGEIISALNTLFGPAGVQFTYLPETFTYTDGSSSTGSTPNASKTLESIDSAALQIAVMEKSAQGPVGAKFTLGRVYVSTTDTPGFSTLGNTGTVGNTGTTGNSGAVTAPAGNTGTIATSGVVPTGSTATAAPSGSTAPGSQAITATPAYAVEEGPPTQSVYLVLVLAALAVLLLSQAVRYLAVRLTMSGG
jgi:hypothetical protein